MLVCLLCCLIVLPWFHPFPRCPCEISPLTEKSVAALKSDVLDVFLLCWFLLSPQNVGSSLSLQHLFYTCWSDNPPQTDGVYLILSAMEWCKSGIPNPSPARWVHSSVWDMRGCWNLLSQDPDNQEPNLQVRCGLGVWAGEKAQEHGSGWIWATQKQPKPKPQSSFFPFFTDNGTENHPSQRRSMDLFASFCFFFPL